MGKRLSVSTVTPVFSGADYLEALVLKLNEVRNQWAEAEMPFVLEESIFVNDDAVDTSAEVLKGLAARFDWVRIVTNAKNFGQHPATIAGILHSSGDWVVTLDEDLQHDPQKIEALLKTAVLHSHDIVYANPKGSVHQARLRDWGSQGVKRALALVTKNKNIPLFNSFRLLRGALARAAACVCSHETYFDIALSWFTNRVAAVPLEMVDPRFVQTGRSGYTFLKLLAHARRMLVSSQAKTLRLVAVVGFVVITVDAAYGLFLFFLKLWNPEAATIRGWASVFLSVLFFGGLTLLMCSIILEYLTGVVLHIQGKPTYFIVDRSGDEVAATFYKNRSD